MLKISITVKYCGHALLIEGYVMEVAVQRGECAHVRLSDFSHIYDSKNKRAAPRCLQKMGEGGGWINLLPARKPSILQKKYLGQHGETRSTIPKYALYSLAMHC